MDGKAIRARLPLIAALAMASLLQAGTRGASPADVEPRVDELLGKMTIEEKVGQLAQASGEVRGAAMEEVLDAVRAGHIGSFFDVHGAANVNRVQRVAVEQSRVKIPVVFGYDVIHGYRTIVPAPLAMAASWDPAAAGRGARVAAGEARGAGVRWTFAPMVDVARDPRWGRMVEGAGEDPYLGAAMARAGPGIPGG